MTHQERADLGLRNLSSAMDRALRRHGDSSTVEITDAEFDDMLSDLEAFTEHVNTLVDAKIENASKAAATAGEPAPA